MTQFLQLVVGGTAVGLQYALVGLGFVIIFKASGVINFAQGGFVMVGAYLTYQFGAVWGLPFPIALVLSMFVTALSGLLIERLILRRMVGKPAFALIMITIGLLFVIQEIAATVWGTEQLNLGDPWGLETFNLGGIVIPLKDMWALILAAVVLGAFFAFFRFSKLGLAMRATALDQEAALAQGMSSQRVLVAAWVIAGSVAALAGTMLAAGPSNLQPTIQFYALAAFPAVILGGLDSPGGAVAGGLIIGLVQTLGAQYVTFSWLGTGFYTVLPYVVMVLVLLVRPYGLFGTPEVKRV